MKKGTCVHFNGVQNDKCDHGIAYNSFNGKLPCLTYRDGHREAPKELCSHFTEPTADQIAAREQQIKQSIERFAKVAPLIGKVKKENRGRDWRGVEVCPVCGGKLHMTHAAYNGHVHGQCETTGCLSWME